MAYTGEIAAMGTAVCWAAGSNFFAAAAARMGPLVLNRLRIPMAMLLLGASLLVLHGSPWPTWASPHDVLVLSLSGLIGFVFGDTYYFKALVILGPGRSAVLTSLAPLFTALLAWPLLGEHLGPLAWAGMGLILSGVAWMSLERTRHQGGIARGGRMWAGTLFGILAALGQGVGYVLSKMALQGGLDALSATVIRVTAAAVGIWMLATAQGQAGATVRALSDRRGAWFMVGGAICGPFLGVTLSLVALQHTQAGVAASITAGYPVLTLLLARYFHSEKITRAALGGAMLTVAGVVVLFLRAR